MTEWMNGYIFKIYMQIFKKILIIKELGETHWILVGYVRENQFSLSKSGRWLPIRKLAFISS